MKNSMIVGLLLGFAACGHPVPQYGDNDGSTNQNNVNPSVCGNEIVEVGEQCDEGTQNSDTAPNACRSTCHLPTCGDGVVDTGEECEGIDFSGSTCQTFGFTRGSLTCGDCVVDTSGCSFCGNGVAEGTVPTEVNYERCDGTDLRGQTCETLGYVSGTLVCTQGCAFDIGGCAVVVPECGNGVAETGEFCDGTDLQNHTCETLGQDPGVLACTTVCTFDFSDCGGPVPECGNDILEVGEICDGADMGGADCLTIGLPYGTLTCTESCVYDISACYATTPVCGNGLVEVGEECDDGNHDVTDECPDGPVGTCQWSTCGDGFVEAGVEGCDDGNGLNGDLCPDGAGGTCELAICGDGFIFVGAEVCDPSADPSCNPDCQTRCGDGVIQSQYEICEIQGQDNSHLCHQDCSGYCGNWSVDANEECEIGPSYIGRNAPDMNGLGSCTYLCNLSYCGDGVCDPPVDGANCPSDCGTCGDGVCIFRGYERNTNCPPDCPTITSHLEFVCHGITYAAYPINGYNPEYGSNPTCCATGPIIYTGNPAPGAQQVLNCGACGHDCQVGEGCGQGRCI